MGLEGLVRLRISCSSENIPEQSTQSQSSGKRKGWIWERASTQKRIGSWGITDAQWPLGCASWQEPDPGGLWPLVPTWKTERRWSGNLTEANRGWLWASLSFPSLYLPRSTPLQDDRTHLWTQVVERASVKSCLASIHILKNWQKRSLPRAPGSG